MREKQGINYIGRSQADDNPIEKLKIILFKNETA